MSTPLSIIILTYNEADVLAPTMQAAATVANELMVVDSFSEDQYSFHCERAWCDKN